MNMSPITPDTLSHIVKILRESCNWTQETLAEIAKLSLKTVQRVEKAEPSSIDTRRALAMAFDIDDIDLFNKSDEEVTSRIYENIEKFENSLSIDLQQVSQGLDLRKYCEGTHGMICSEIHKLPQDVNYLVEELQEYVRDIMDIYNDLTTDHKKNIDIDFQNLLNKLKQHGYCVGINKRSIDVNDNSEPKLEWQILQIVIGLKKDFPDAIRVPKKFNFI